MRKTYNNVQLITLKTKLHFESDSDRRKLLEVLELERDIFNFCSKRIFKKKVNNIIQVHKLCYKRAKKVFVKAKSQFIIKAENSCLSVYRSIKSNKVKLKTSATKKRLSMSYDKRISRKVDEGFYLTTCISRILVKLHMYDRLKSYWKEYQFGDVVISVNNNDVYISITFYIPYQEVKSKSVVGIDLGCRCNAATSEGKLILSKSFNAQKRKLRYLKRCLNSKTESKTAKKHLQKIRYKERNINKNFNHHLCNEILKTKANTIAVEKLQTKKLKAKRHRYQNKNRISQISFAKLLFILTYKARLAQKQVVSVSPYYTSQLDCTTGKIGIRQGRRFYGTKLIFDADINAAVNIASRSNLPFSYSNILEGQGSVTDPLRYLQAT